MKRAPLALAWAVIGVAFFAGLIYVAAEGPYWFKDTSPAVKTSGEGRWWSQEIQGNRTAILAMLGGTLAAFGALVTYMNLRVTRRGHQTDRFAKAVELLGDDKPATRLGGIYALDAIARESPVDRQAVINVLDLHRESDDEHSSEADRRAAEAVAERLRPTPTWSPGLASIASIGFYVLALVALAVGLKRISGPDPEPQETLAVITVLSAAAGVAAHYAARRAERTRRITEQRPLFESEEYFVRPEPDGTWSVRKSDAKAPPSAFAADEDAAIARALGFILGPVGVVYVLDSNAEVQRRHYKRTILERFDGASQ